MSTRENAKASHDLSRVLHMCLTRTNVCESIGLSLCALPIRSTCCDDDLRASAPVPPPRNERAEIVHKCGCTLPTATERMHERAYACTNAVWLDCARIIMAQLGIPVCVLLLYMFAFAWHECRADVMNTLCVACTPTTMMRVLPDQIYIRHKQAHMRTTNSPTYETRTHSHAPMLGKSQCMCSRIRADFDHQISTYAIYLCIYTCITRCSCIERANAQHNWRAFRVP